MKWWANELTRKLLPCLTACVVASAAVAAEPEQAPAVDHVIAIFVTPKGQIESDWIDTLKAQLVEHPGSLPRGRLLVGATLTAALGEDADAASGLCGPNVTCLAGLGKKAGAETVLYTRLVAAKFGITVQCLIINVMTASIADKTAFDVRTLDSMATMVTVNLTQMFPDAAKPKPVESAPKSDAGSEPAIVFEWDNSAAPSPSPASIWSAAAPETPPSDQGAAARKYTRAELFEEFAVEDPHADRGALAVDAGVIAAPQDAGITESGGLLAPVNFLRMWRYGGFGLSGAGLVGIGLGIVFGAIARSQNDSIKGGPNGMTQIQAAQKLSDANTNGSRANVCFALGGLAAAAGGTALGLEYFYWRF
jgi:hypothetical protein